MTTNNTTYDLSYSVRTADSLAAALADTEASAIAALTGDVTIAIAANEDEDDCLAAAAEMVSDVLDLDGWDLRARWEPDGSREYVWLTVPAHALHAARGVETLPASIHLAIGAGTESDVSDAPGALDYDVTLTIGERTVEGGITLWPDKINGGMAPCDAPDDGWISNEIVRELRAMPDAIARKVRASLAALSEGEVD